MFLILTAHKFLPCLKILKIIAPKLGFTLHLNLRYTVPINLNVVTFVLFVNNQHKYTVIRQSRYIRYHHDLILKPYECNDLNTCFLFRVETKSSIISIPNNAERLKIMEFYRGLIYD